MSSPLPSWSEEEEDDEDDPYAYLSRRDDTSISTTGSNTPQLPTLHRLPQQQQPQQQPQQERQWPPPQQQQEQERQWPPPQESQQQQHQRQPPQQSQQSPLQEQETTTVCCGCRPKATSTKWKRYKKKSRFNLFQSSTMYYDAPESHLPKTGIRIPHEEISDESSMFYFDAVETPLGEDEYPPFFTTSIPHPKPNVTLDDPITLLKHSPTSPKKGKGRIPDEGEDEKEEEVDLHPQKPISSHKRRSVRWEQITRRPTMEHTHALSEPRVPQAEQGYPGGLTIHELEECQKFLRGLKMLDSAIMDQVYSFRDVEEEPYTICRWLRATKFKADAILERLEENQPMFEHAQKHDFYPMPTKTLAAPISVFLSQYPFLPIGSAKNGCPVNYFMAGQINPEGILSITTIDRLEAYFWWSFMWKMKDEVRRAQEKDPDFVRMEGINIVDLKGLSSSALSSETMEVIKVSSKVADFFPETLHCMLILNAPGFFSFSWTIIKKFLDARTAARIQVFSSEEKGLQALRALIGSDQIPRDYGGSNISVQQAFAKQAADPSLLRQEVELVHVKKGKKSMSKNTWTLMQGEVMTISVYTRSVSGACVFAYLDGQVLATVEAACSSNSEDDGAVPLRTCVRLAKIKRPGMVSMEVQDLDNAPRHHKGLSRGYFLIVGDVKREKEAK